MNDEQRTFLRILTRLRARLRRQVSPAMPQVFREAPIASSSVTTAELKNAGLAEALVDALMNLDRKLDLLIGLHSYDTLQEDFPLTAEVVEISGAGVKLLCDEPLEENEHVEVVIVLTQLPVRMASAVAQVVRKETTPDGQTAWALDFVKIRDRDLESIVQFVFQTQRDELRCKKWS